MQQGKKYKINPVGIEHVITDDTLPFACASRPTFLVNPHKLDPITHSTNTGRTVYVGGYVGVISTDIP